MPPLASKGGHALASGFLILRNTQTHDLAGGWEPPLRWLGGNLPAKHQFVALLSKTDKHITEYADRLSSAIG